MLVDGGIPLSASAPMPSSRYQAKQIHCGLVSFLGSVSGTCAG